LADEFFPKGFVLVYSGYYGLLIPHAFLSSFSWFNHMFLSQLMRFAQYQFMLSIYQFTHNQRLLLRFKEPTNAETERESSTKRDSIAMCLSNHCSTNQISCKITKLVCFLHSSLKISFKLISFMSICLRLNELIVQFLDIRFLQVQILFKLTDLRLCSAIILSYYDLWSDTLEI
jgi:hypothetical protein